MLKEGMNVKVLGSVSPYCKEDRNCPGYLVTSNESKILLDCGSGITRLLKFPEDLNNLNIIISHLHEDHYSDLFSIAYASYVNNKLGLLNEKVRVFIPKIYEPKEWERSVSKEWYDYQLIKNLKNHYFELITYDQNTNFLDKYKLNVNVMKNYHAGMESYSIKIFDDCNSLVYTGDIGYKYAEELINFSKGVDLLISESTYVRTDDKYDVDHLHAYEAAEIARYARPGKLLLTHFWPEHNPYDYLEEAKPIYPYSEIAAEGNKLKLARYRYER